ncbi:MAG TPA: hypothetical protein VFW08_07795 [bacterium]|nr:hypothetical protein [bacterium]
MRTSVITLLLLVTMLAIPPVTRAGTQVFLAPSQFTFATPSGTFNWSATSIGGRFGPSLGPLEFGTMLSYAPVNSLSFMGSPLSGYSGQMFAGEIGPRFALGFGPIGVGASAGYGGFVLNARGPAASDAVLLSSLGFRLGVDARLTVAPTLSVRAGWTALTGLSTRADFSVSAPVAVVAQHAGSGSGSEFSIGVSFAPLPLVAAYAEYRSGTFFTGWSGGGSTSSSYSGYVLGVQVRF